MCTSLPGVGPDLAACTREEREIAGAENISSQLFELPGAPSLSLFPGVSLNFRDAIAKRARMRPRVRSGHRFSEQPIRNNCAAIIPKGSSRSFEGMTRYIYCSENKTWVEEGHVPAILTSFSYLAFAIRKFGARNVSS